MACHNAKAGNPELLSEAPALLMEGECNRCLRQLHGPELVAATSEPSIRCLFLSQDAFHCSKPELSKLPAVSV